MALAISFWYLLFSSMKNEKQDRVPNCGELLD
eukprot:COSAG05_NODE_8461_length_702_cov_0.492537_2_plen_31_part_01